MHLIYLIYNIPSTDRRVLAHAQNIYHCNSVLSWTRCNDNLPSAVAKTNFRSKRQVASQTGIISRFSGWCPFKLGGSTSENIQQVIKHDNCWHILAEWFNLFLALAMFFV